MNRDSRRTLWAAASARLKALFKRSDFEAEMDEEIRFHIDKATERNVGTGMPLSEARRQALREFGGVERTKEQVRTETGVRLLQDLGKDLKQALRHLYRHPTFTFVVVCTIAVSIGINAAVFSGVHSVILRPLPFPESGELVRIFNSYPLTSAVRSGASPPDYFDRREFVGGLDDVALYSQSSFTRGGGEDRGQHTFSLWVTPSFFSVLRTTPALGRVFVYSDGSAADRREVVIGHKLWQTGLGQDPEVVGTDIILNGDTHTIVGVLPESFRFSNWDAQVFAPLKFSPEDRAEGTRHSDNFEMIGRLATGATAETVQSEILSLNRSLVADYSIDLRNVINDAGYTTVVRPYLADLTRDIRTPFFLMWAGALLVLVIGISNVTSLFLIRARSRSEEIASRMALGAGPFRILRQLLTESTVLAVFGGVLGLAIARWSLGLLDAFAVYEIPRIDQVSLNGVVLAWSLGAIGVMSCIAGFVPARRLLNNRGTSLLVGHRGGTDRGTSQLYRGLVSGQIALAFMLVMGAGLLVSSLRNLTSVDPGFDAENVVVAAITLPGASYPGPESRRQFVDQFLETVSAIPGVVSVATATQIPFSGTNERGPFSAEGSNREQGEPLTIGYRTFVSSDYFETLSIDVVAGRGFLPSDDHSSVPVAVIDERLATLLWPDSDPVGRRMWREAEVGASENALTIIGVVSSVKQNSLSEDSQPGAVYFSALQQPRGFFRVLAKTEGDRGEVWGNVQKQLTALDPDLILFWNDTMEESVGSTLILQRTPMQLLSVFAVVGLLLGILGVYGVMAYAVSRRRREIGLRMAIGSTGPQVASLIGREWVIIVGVGLSLGLLATLVSTRVLQGLLFGVEALDPWVLSGTVVTVVAATLVACYVPVRHALSIDPATALKGD